MPDLAEPKQRKLHVNLTLRADLYGTAQAHAKAEGLSVSALFERILQSMAMGEPRPVADANSLRGILQGPWADLGKREARAARHDARSGKGGE